MKNEKEPPGQGAAVKGSGASPIAAVWTKREARGRGFGFLFYFFPSYTVVKETIVLKSTAYRQNTITSKRSPRVMIHSALCKPHPIEGRTPQEDPLSSRILQRKASQPRVHKASQRLV